MKAKILLFTGIVVISAYAVSTSGKNNISQHRKVDNLPPDLVPDEKTAIKIAEAIWLPLFGEEIYKEKPFKAVLTKKNTWIVYGTLPDGGDSVIVVGGTAHIEIQKSDCKILNVTHYK